MVWLIFLIKVVKMDELLLYDLAEEYADKFISSVQFERFLELGKLIKVELAKLIVSFKNAEALYLEAKEYGKYHPDLKKYTENFVNAKTKLFSHPLMIEYKELEFKLQNILNNDMNDLKKSISNKLEITKNIVLD